MPLLMCPNDNAPMQTVERAGVQFDMCPSCRGVWLDRGELEKLMAATRDDVAARPEPPRQAYQQPAPPPYRDDYRRDEPRRDDHRGYDPRYHKKKRGFDLFDIFD